MPKLCQYETHLSPYFLLLQHIRWRAKPLFSTCFGQYMGNNLATNFDELVHAKNGFFEAIFSH